MSILKAENLIKMYGQEPNIVKALDDVSIEIKEGQFVAIVGTSGSGKSTLLNMLGGLDKLTSGEVYINDKKLSNMNDEEITIFRRRNIGFIFQNYNLVQILNVYENIVLPIELDGIKKLSNMNDEEITIFRRRNIGFIFQNYNLVQILNVYENIVLPIELDGMKIDEEYVNSIINTLGLKDKLANMPNNLSGGQQQRVAIARALATKPAIILADEPTGNLDSKTSMDVIGLLKMTSQKFNQTMVMITHNEEIAQLADRIIRIEDGKVVKGE